MNNIINKIMPFELKATLKQEFNFEKYKIKQTYYSKYIKNGK